MFMVKKERVTFLPLYSDRGSHFIILLRNG